MGIVEALAAGKALVEASKLARDLVNNPDVEPHRVRTMVHEMMIHLTNAQTRLAEAQQEIIELRNQLDDRKELEALKTDMQYQSDGEFYLRQSEIDKGLLPYCPVCWRDRNKVIHLQINNENGRYRCPSITLSIKRPSF
jgi:hypothetical protein